MSDECKAVATHTHDCECVVHNRDIDECLALLRKRLEAAEKVVELSRVVGDCFEHDGNCCSEWCDRCQTSKDHWKSLANALEAFDAAKGGM